MAIVANSGASNQGFTASGICVVIARSLDLGVRGGDTGNGHRRQPLATAG
ncbi:unannotated protein [freshwater metagenome]|uniref:Unannotated protein n=1 Tax=freshwater metagenome TaxID=449393 RepID=A0A6J6U9Q6_9ZZZZ